MDSANTGPGSPNGTWEELFERATRDGWSSLTEAEQRQMVAWADEEFWFRDGHWVLPPDWTVDRQ